MRAFPTVLIAGLILCASVAPGFASGGFRKIDRDALRRIVAMRDQWRSAPGADQSRVSLPGPGPAASLGATGWVGNGVAVAPFATGQLAPTACPDGIGGALTAWMDFRTGGADIYATRIDMNGNLSAGWPAAGVRLCTLDSLDFQPYAVPDGSNGAFVVFGRYSTAGTFEVRAQHVTSSGAIASGWAADGKALSSTPATGYGAITTNDGFLLAGWQDVNGNLWARRLTSAGGDAPGWSSSGLLVGGALNAGSIGEAPDGAGGAYLAWVRTDSVLLTRVAVGGGFATGWTSAGLLVRDVTAAGSGVSAALLTSGDAIVFWEDIRNGLDIDIYAMRCTAAGGIDAGWTAGGVPVGVGSANKFNPESVPDAAGGAIVIWQDDPGNLVAQRVTSTGAIASGWPAFGTPLCSGAAGKTFGRPVPDGASGALIAWSESAADLDVFTQLVASNGSIATGWPAEGAVMSNAANDQDFPALVSDNAGGGIVLWEDFRGIFPQIYAGRVGSDGIVPALASLVSATATADRVALRWFTPDAAAFEADLERAAGSADFVALARLEANGDGEIVYEDRAVIAGESYRYRLVASENGERRVFGEAEVRVPFGTRLAVAGFRPNPALGAPRIAYTLESVEPARLEVMDIAGRRIAARDLPGVPGEQVVTLDRERFAPGLYLIRLSQGSHRAFARAVLTK